MATIHDPAFTPASSAPPLKSPSGEPITVVHLTAEYLPYARTGGLAEAVSCLAGFQRAAGHNVAAILPLYRTVRDEDPDLEPVGQPFIVPIGGRAEEARVFRVAGPHPGPQVFFIEHLGYFNRVGIYGESGADYPDNARRFAFFALAAMIALPRLVPGPVLLHAHDWHTALAPVYLRTVLAADRQQSDAGHRGLGPQSRLPGTLPAPGRARHRAAVGGVQLAAARVVREAQLPQGRAGVRGLRHHGESHPGARAADARWRLRPAGRVPLAG